MDRLNLPKHLLSPDEPEPDGEASVDDLPAPDLGLTPEQLQAYHLLNRRGSGRKVSKPPLEAYPDGPLSLADLAALEETRLDGRQKCGTVQLSRVRSIHHQIAQYLAMGYRDIEVSALLGVSSQRIAHLKSDPAFTELSEYYAEKQKAVGTSILERLSSLAVLGLEEIQDRLLDEPELMNNTQITKLVEMLLDRSGFAPGGSSQNKPGGELPSEDVARLKQAINQESKTKVVSRAEAAEYLAAKKGGVDGED